MNFLYNIPMTIFWSIIVVLVGVVILGAPTLMILAILSLPPQVVLTLVGLAVLYLRFGAGRSRPH